MSGNSDKKAAQKKVYWQQVLYAIIGVVTGLYALAYVLSDGGFWDYAGLAFFSLVNKITSGSILGAIEMGYNSEYYLDVFAVNLLAQVSCVFTRSGWYAYLLIPGYFAYLLVRKCLDFAGKSPEEDETPLDPLERKRLEKQKRKEERKERGKFKVMR